MMAKIIFTKEIVEFIRTNVKGRRDQELVDAVNEKFGTNLVISQMRNFRTRKGFRNELGTGPIEPTKITTNEQDEFILKHYKGLYNTELTDLVNYWFKTSYTVEQMKSYKARNKLDSGLKGQFMKGNEPFNKGLKQEEYMSAEAIEKTKTTRFKKGQEPVNWEPIGFERITKDGYTEIKVRDKKGVHSTENFELKQRWLYERYHDKEIADDEVILFLDQDKTNFDVDNLEKITREDLGRVNKLLSDNPDLNVAAVSYSRLISKIKEMDEGETIDG